MNNWRPVLLGYTGLFIVFALWTPMIWFISTLRTHYHMETFELHRADWMSIILFITLVLATLVAQFGFVAIAHDLSRLEALNKTGPTYQPFRGDVDA